MPVSPAPWAELPDGLGAAIAESKTRSAWKPMKQVALSMQLPPPSRLGVICVVFTGCVTLVAIGTDTSMLNVGADTVMVVWSGTLLDGGCWGRFG